MRSGFKKGLAVLLAVIMTVGLAPMLPRDMTAPVAIGSVWMRGLSLRASAATYSGSCGADGSSLTWTFYTYTGTLTISGTGAMQDYVYDSDTGTFNMPWWNYSPSVLKLIIGNGVTYIGKSAFSYCTQMTSVTIPGSVTRIGEGAFISCSSLNELTIPDGVTDIEQLAFRSCTKLSDVTIAGTVRNIGTQAFRSCTQLTHVTIPGSVTSMGDSPFLECERLTSVTVEQGNTHFSSDANGILYNKDQTTLIAFPIGSGKTAFTIPSSVTCIGNSAFYQCGSLVQVTIPDNVTEIEEGAFYACANLAHVAIGRGVKSIGAYVFFGCGKLSDVTIREGVQHIGFKAFGECTSLTALTIPDSVTSIGEAPFEYCTGLTSITVGKGNTQFSSDAYGALYNKDQTTLIAYPAGSDRTRFDIPDSVTEVGGYAFSGCADLVHVSIPYGITRISDRMFSMCGNLAEITIPNGVTTIGEYAFYGCGMLSEVTVPDGVTSIGNRAFRESGLTHVTLPSSVTSIGVYSFYMCANLTDVTILSHAVRIDEYAFYRCYALADVTIQGGETEIGDWVFARCTSLSAVTISGAVTRFGEGVFRGCTALKEIWLPSGFTAIPGNMFNQCSALERVHIPSSVTSIASSAFSGASPVICCETTDCYAKTFAAANSLTFNRCSGHSAHEHAYTVVTTRQPSCTESGSIDYICSGCGATYHESIPAIGHLWNYDGASYSWEEDNSACTRTVTCTRNPSHFLQDTVYAVRTVTREATCTQTGSADFSAVFNNPSATVNQTEEIPALGHDYQAQTASATCLEGGYMIYTCTRCADSYTSEWVQATGHDWQLPDTVTWSEDYSTCTITCVCRNNSEHTLTLTVPAEFTVDEEPTCYAEGVGTCYAHFTEPQQAYYYEMVYLPKKHAYNEGIVTKAPTVIEEGEIVYTCLICGGTKTEILPKHPPSANDPVFSLSAGTAHAGETIEIALCVHNNPGIVSAALRLTYDPRLLRLTDVQNGNVFGEDAFHADGSLDGIPYAVGWTSALNKNNAQDGTLVTFIFAVADDAPAGSAAVSVTYDSAATFDAQMQSAAFAVQNAEWDLIARKAGDVSGDGVLNLKDAALLIRAAAGWDVSVIRANADVNGDKSVDLRDAALLMRCLAGGWGVVLE